MPTDDEVTAPAGLAVTVLLPVLNEAQHLRSVLEQVRAQTYQPTEILVIDGGSTDDTCAIATATPGVKVLRNPERIQAAALNIGLSSARGSIIIRVDGHTRIERDYIEQCVAALRNPDIAMVGGAMRPVGHSALQRGIALAMSSPFGAGPARFHVGGPPASVDTVYLGAYRREDALAVGGYSSWMHANEDAEFALRMRARGSIWFDPNVRSAYEPRSTLGALSRQFARYGFWRAVTVRRHPRSLSSRQLPAPLLTLALLSPLRRKVAALYAIGIILVTFKSTFNDRPLMLPFAVSLPVMHLSWGAGFLTGFLRPAGSGRPNGA